MSLIAKEKGGSSIPPLDADVYEAVCISLIDLGTQVDEYKGQPKVNRKVWISWVVPSETVSIDGEDKPRVVGSEYALGLSERHNLRKLLEGWRGRAFTAEELEGFNLTNVLAKPCRLNTGHWKSGSTKIEGALKSKNPEPIPDGMEPFAFDLDAWDGAELPDEIPEFIKAKIAESPEYQEKTKPATREVDVDTTDDTIDENVPF